MTAPKRGVQVKIIPGTTTQDGRGGWKTAPVTVVRARKPRKGGVTLAVFTNRDGDGHQSAMKYINEKGHTLA